MTVGFSFRCVLAVCALALLALPGAARAADAPGGPGRRRLDRGRQGRLRHRDEPESRVWHTLDDGELTEVYYPDLGTPAARDLQLVVTDGGRSPTASARTCATRLKLVDPRSLSYRQVNTAPRYRITKTYTTDPSRSVLLMHVRFESPGRCSSTRFDPGLSNSGDDDPARPPARAGRMRRKAAAHCRAPGAHGSPRLSGQRATAGPTSRGPPDGLDLRAAPTGNVAQTARLR